VCPRRSQPQLFCGTSRLLSVPGELRVSGFFRICFVDGGSDGEERKARLLEDVRA
jgi:hypothetical protein